MFEFERATSISALWSAWQRISGNNSKSSGIDQIDLDFYRPNARENVEILHYSLISDSYEPYKEKSFESRKKRTIFISSLEDKIVQSAISAVIYDAFSINPGVHGFIKKRSIFTAHTALKKAMKQSISNYFKADIFRFYESIDNTEIVRILTKLFDDEKFISLVKRVVFTHSPGLSTGSSLSPVLSNLYLSEYDENIRKNAAFYSRYVDDMLLAPLSQDSMPFLIDITNAELNRIGLRLNEEKSNVVNTRDGFVYLGFDIKTKNKLVDDLLMQGDFSSANELVGTEVEKEENSCIATEKQEKEPFVQEKESIDHKEANEVPSHVLAIAKKCHIVAQMVSKAQTENYLSYPEKQTLLHIYHCLGEDGQKYLHWILNHCRDYNYSVTQGFIERCRVIHPIGCKKLSERFDEIYDKSKCKCNFSSDKMYSSPVVHALRRKPGCILLPKKEDRIGHFKQLPPKQGVSDALSRLLELNKKEYEIHSQQKICSGQLESLFERNNFTEIQTPQGILIKNEDGFFIKVG